MRVRRDVSSIPYRSASETWQRIIDLVTGRGSQDVQQLKDAAGVMGSIITDEHPAARAILIEGVGPQLRIYCRYGMKAVEEGGGVDSLTWNPTAGDWTMHVPCDAENIDWVTESLAETSPRINPCLRLYTRLHPGAQYRVSQRQSAEHAAGSDPREWPQPEQADAGLGND